MHSCSGGTHARGTLPPLDKLNGVKPGDGCVPATDSTSMSSGGIDLVASAVVATMDGARGAQANEGKATRAPQTGRVVVFGLRCSFVCPARARPHVTPSLAGVLGRSRTARAPLAH